MELLPRPLEKFGESLRIVTGHVVENRGLGVLELVGDEVRQNRPLERIEERRAEHVRTVLGGVGVGRPRTDHRRRPVLRHPARGNRLLGGLRADDDQHFVLGDQLGIGLHRGLGLGLVVLDDQLHLVFLAPDLEAAGAVHVGKPHLGRELGALADLGNVTGERDVEADLDGLGRNTRGQGKNSHSTDDGVQMSFQFHGCLLSVFLLGIVTRVEKSYHRRGSGTKVFFRPPRLCSLQQKTCRLPYELTGQDTSVVSHKYAYESAGPFGSAHPERSEAKSKGGCVALPRVVHGHTGGFETRPYKSSRLADDQNALASS